MRQIFLDIETTGLNVSEGERIVEIAALEVLNRRKTGQHFHCYLNPDGHPINADAFAVHGLSNAFLQDKPRFADVYQELLTFIRGAELLIHNAPFDTGFLDYELGLLGVPPIQTVVAQITDTLKIARTLRPAQRNSLDSLCKHYGISLAQRELHSARVDTELLADVYLAMTRGQSSLGMATQSTAVAPTLSSTTAPPPIVVLPPSDEELSAHQSYLARLTGQRWQ